MTLAQYLPGGAVASLVLDNPSKLNAMSALMFDDIARALDSFDADPDARVLVVRGAGTSFSAGVQLGQGSTYGSPSTADDLVRLQGMAELWLRFWDSPRPVIAQVHGYCLAGALHLPLCCDIVVVAADAVIGSPKVPLGAGWIGSMLAHRIGAQRAKAFMFQLGSQLTGAEAAELGFAAFAVDASDLDQTVQELAARIARTPADLLRIEKQAINAVADRAGFRASIHEGTLWDAISHSSPGVAEAKQLVAEIGIRAAVANYSSAPPQHRVEGDLS